MKRFAVVLGLLMLAGACDKPSEENCRKALANVRTLLGTGSPEADVQGDVRRCKGGSNKKTVECAMAATSIEQLKAIGVTVGLSVVATAVLAYAIKAVIGLRPSAEHEIQGLDLVDHGEAAYHTEEGGSRMTSSKEYAKG